MLRAFSAPNRAKVALGSQRPRRRITPKVAVWAKSIASMVALGSENDENNNVEIDAEIYAEQNKKTTLK